MSAVTQIQLRIHGPRRPTELGATRHSGILFLLSLPEEKETQSDEHR